MGYIYKVTNKVNGKIYIGQTTETISKRWKRHVRESRQDEKNVGRSHLHRAIRKYGKESFEVEEIEECSSDELDNREKHWIAKYDSFHSGYNMTIGGEGGLIYSDEELLRVWNSGMNFREAEKTLGYSQANLSRRLKVLGITKEEIESRRYASVSAKLTYPVYQYSLEGDLIAEHETLKSAVKKFGPSIYDAVLLKTPTCFGYQWRNYKCDRISPAPQFGPGIKRKVHQYDLNGKYIAEFPSIVDAGKSVGVTTTAIWNVCTHKAKSSAGYQWSFEKKDYICEIAYKSFRRVAQIDSDGNIINTYNTIIEASRTTGTSEAGIIYTCKGKQKTAGGYKWRYLEENGGNANDST